MEDESRVFGSDAKNSDTFDSEETFDFFRKEETKQNIEKSATDLTDFIDSLIQDVPAPSAEEVNAGIEKILARTHPAEAQIQTSKTAKIKKVSFRVLFIAAILSVFMCSCLYAVGNSHNISIENGFVSFAKETIQVVFFGSDEEEYISVDSLLTNLEENGYVNILFPQEFVTKSDEYKVSVPEYSDDSSGKQVSFNIYNDTSSYSFNIILSTKQTILDYTNLKNAQTFVVNGVSIYVFEHSGYSSIEFIDKKYSYSVFTDAIYNDAIDVVKTIE